MAVFGVDGVPGSGKTAYSVQTCWYARRKGRPVYANIPLIDTRVNWDGTPKDPASYGWPWASYVSTIDDLLPLRRGLVLLDECDMWFASVEWQKVSKEKRSFWTQHRKRGLDVMWTCTYIDNILNTIRNITQTQHRCCMVPFAKNKRIIKKFNPQETRSVKKGTGWKLLTLHQSLYGIYSSGFVVSDGKTPNSISGELGGVDYGEGADLDIQLGTAAELIDLASEPRFPRPEVLRPGLSPKKPALVRHQVAPVLQPVEVWKLRAWLLNVQALGLDAKPSDRVAARRLAPVVAGLVGKA